MRYFEHTVSGTYFLSKSSLMAKKRKPDPLSPKTNNIFQRTAIVLIIFTFAFIGYIAFTIAWEVNHNYDEHIPDAIIIGRHAGLINLAMLLTPVVVLGVVTYLFRQYRITNGIMIIGYFAAMWLFDKVNWFEYFL